MGLEEEAERDVVEMEEGEAVVEMEVQKEEEAETEAGAT